MSPYAEGTEVTVEKSRSELHRLVVAKGAKDFLAGEVGGAIQLIFRMDVQPAGTAIADLRQRHVRIVVPLPTYGDEAILRTAAGKERSESGQRAALEAELRRRWRALYLVVKAKLEAVESGISTFEQEFLAHLVVRGGKTFGEVALPALDSGSAERVAGLLGAGGP